MATILCIDDEPLVREDIAEVLVDCGFFVLEASDGLEGLDMILKHEPDLVICDITMPRMNGRELLDELRNRHKRFDRMPFLFLSALSDEDQIISGLKQGAYNYLTKPVDFKLLIVTIEASLDHVDAEKQHNELSWCPPA